MKKERFAIFKRFPLRTILALPCVLFTAMLALDFVFYIVRCIFSLEFSPSTIVGYILTILIFLFISCAILPIQDKHYRIFTEERWLDPCANMTAEQIALVHQHQLPPDLDVPIYLHRGERPCCHVGAIFSEKTQTAVSMTGTFEKKHYEDEPTRIKSKIEYKEREDRYLGDLVITNSRIVFVEPSVGFEITYDELTTHYVGRSTISFQTSHGIYDLIVYSPKQISDAIQVAMLHSVCL